jgi:presenilin-like A22 family membrane protease
MKHKLQITLILISMFLIAQVIGLFVVHATEDSLPFGLQETSEEEGTPGFLSIIFAFIFAFALIFILMKYKWKLVIRIWFLVVITLALGISTYAMLSQTSLNNIQQIAILIAVPLALLKIFYPNVYIHNITELLIYPGIAAVFVPILTPITAIALLIFISIYDAWAVWRVGLMQKMAKFQMEELRIFGGLMIPSVSNKIKNQIDKIKQKYKGKKIPKKIQKRKFKINLAILGGGDIVFPIITAGVFMRFYGLVPALFVTGGAFLGLSYLFIRTEKGKAYPAMPYISIGIFIGIILSKLLVM